MPEPAGVALVPDKRPHLIHLCLRFARALHVPGHLGGVQRAQYSSVHRLQYRGFLPEFTQHGVGTDMQGSRRIAYSARVETHVDDWVVFQKWRWTEMNVTLGLIFAASHRKEWPMTFIAVRCPHCQSDQI